MDLNLIHCVNQLAIETVLTKSVNSCFIETNFKEIFYQMNCSTVFMFRLTTEYCVSTIATIAKKFGY